MSDIYDDPEIRATGTGTYTRWDTPKTIIGDVHTVRRGTSLSGDTVPELVIRLDNGTDTIVTAAQTQLLAEIMTHRPQVGDRVEIAYTGDEDRGGGKRLKLFTVKVQRGAAKTSPATAASVDIDDEPF